MTTKHMFPYLGELKAFEAALGFKLFDEFVIYWFSIQNYRRFFTRLNERVWNSQYASPKLGLNANFKCKIMNWLDLHKHLNSHIQSPSSDISVTIISTSLMIKESIEIILELVYLVFFVMVRVFTKINTVFVCFVIKGTWFIAFYF